MELDVLIDEATIQARVRELAADIRADYGDTTITCVGVLKGSFIFMADLVRAIEGELECNFLGVSSYKGKQSTGAVRITHDLTEDIEGKHVLLIEDIVDTGLTLDYMLQTLRVRHPETLKVVSLLDKPSRRKVQVPVNYIGFTIEDHFVVGYGLDLDQKYRNLPYVGQFR